MNDIINISPDEGTGQGSGGGPDDDSRYGLRTLREYGFSALAFGFAMGLTLMIFFGLFRLKTPPGIEMATFLDNINPNLWLCFVYGFIGGTLISGIYNFMVIRRIQFFGL